MRKMNKGSENVFILSANPAIEIVIARQKKVIDKKWKFNDIKGINSRKRNLKED